MKLTEEDKECAFNGTFLRTKIAFISRAPGADLRMEEFKIMVQIDGVRTNRTPTGLFHSDTSSSSGFGGIRVGRLEVSLQGHKVAGMVDGLGLVGFLQHSTSVRFLIQALLYLSASFFVCFSREALAEVFQFSLTF